MVTGIQITPTSCTRPALGSYVGVATVVVRTREPSASATTMVVRTSTPRFAFRLALWTDEVVNSVGRKRLNWLFLSNYNVVTKQRWCQFGLCFPRTDPVRKNRQCIK